MLRWGRVLIGCGVGVVALFAYVRFFGCQTELAVDAWYLGWKYPILWKVPAELSDQSISNSPGRRFSYLGYDFEVPWDDLDKEHTKPIRTWLVINFQSGKTIVFMGHQPDGLLKAFRREEVIRERYGDDYATLRQILDASPDKLTPFTSRREAIGEFWSLNFKQAFMINGESGVFLIGTPDFRGFQYGNPKTGNREIRDELYSEQGSIGFMFRSRNSVSISQAEINRVIQSVRRTGDQSLGSNTTGAQPAH
ncbi:MAG: hypothetical protein ABSC63_06495 [Candidatus Binataceae bacterium]|jgi:hypothetical protein